MKPNPESIPTPDTGPINILIVDDELRNLVVLETVLDDPGYRLVRAESAEQALLALLADDFALLILDIGMPGTSGLELAQTIRCRKKSASIPIVFLTAYYHEDLHVLEGYAAGAVDYLHKPVNPTILRSKVAVFVELHRKRREIATANQALRAEVALRRQAEEQLRALSHRVVQAQEAERARVALELHDHITQMLCAIIVRSQTLAGWISTHEGPTKQEAIHLCELLGQTAEEVQRISRNLRPSILEHLGLVAVLQDTSNEFARRTGVTLTLDCAPLTPRLPAVTELALYRILQEALRNVERHADARHVSVQLAERDDVVKLTVTDDGTGFTPEDFLARRAENRGLGVLGMRERAAYVGGDFRIHSLREVGTEIVVCIPLQRDASIPTPTDK